MQISREKQAFDPLINYHYPLHTVGGPGAPGLTHGYERPALQAASLGRSRRVSPPPSVPACLRACGNPPRASCHVPFSDSPCSSSALPVYSFRFLSAVQIRTKGGNHAFVETGRVSVRLCPGSVFLLRARVARATTMRRSVWAVRWRIRSRD